jgi:hypothetical protein
MTEPPQVRRLSSALSSKAPGDVRLGAFGWSGVVGRGGVEPPTFRFQE